MMEKEAQEELQIRRYLLGQLAETEQTRVEERMMTDDEYFEWLLVIEDELIDESTSGALSAEDQERFDRHFLSTPERRERVLFAETLKSHINRQTDDPAAQPSPSPQPIRSPRPVWWMLPNPYVRLAAAAVVLLAIGLVVTYIIFRPSPASKDATGMAALRAAYPNQRPTDARITGWDYAPKPPNTRGNGQAEYDYIARDNAEILIRDAARKHPDAQSYHDLGRLYLAKQEYDKAIDQFEKALTLAEKNAQLESDYGAALLEMGKMENPDKRLETLARAREHLNKAIELDGSLLEALFNRALCRQEMQLVQQAEADWRAYLEKDPNSGWADEARQRLKELEERKNKTARNREQLFEDFLHAYGIGNDEDAWQALSQSRTRTGNFTVEKLLDGFLDRAAQGYHDEANNYLRMLSYAGEIESRRVSDHFTLGLARFYASTTPAQQIALSRARRLIQLANAHSSKSQYDQAISLYRQAKQIFRQHEDDCEMDYAAYRMSQCSLRQSGAKTSTPVFEQLATACKRDQYKWLLALIYNSLADANNSLSEHSTELAYSTQALQLCEEIEDIGGVVRCYIQVAIAYQKVNDYGRSLACLQRGLSLAGDRPWDTGLLWIFYDVAAEAFKSLNLYVAAIDYQKEALQLAVEINSPLTLSRSYAHLGFIYGKLKNYDEAIETAGRAFEIGKSLTADSMGREIMAYASLYLGDLYRQKGDYAQALAYYDQNINLYTRLDFPLHFYATHKGKLLCYLAQGDNSAARDEMAKTLSLFEQYRAKILEESNRNCFFNIEQNIYDTAIDFEHTRLKDDWAAFDKSEYSRARSLLDLADKDVRMVQEQFGPDLALSSNAQPLTAKEVQSRLPAPSQIMQYAMLEDKLLIWVLSNAALSKAEEPVGITDLSQKVERYLQKVSHPPKDAEETTREARELYDLLIKPVEPYLDKGKYLCIVPDKALNRLPFVALISEAGNYLVNDYSLGVCPSSTLFIKRSDTARSKAGRKAESFLGIGNPSFDRAASPGLQDLPASAAEAEAVAALYQASPLLGSRATESLVKRRMAHADVLHLATHYVPDGNSPLLSAFLLAQEPEGASQNAEADGRLQIYEIYAMKLSRLRLAVLAACRTGIEQNYQGEGAISVARPFIAAGVPVVVASLWPVDSDSTSVLMVNFHRYRKRDELSTAQALGLAQRDMIKDARFHHPYYWASFAAIGGYATF